MGRCGAVRTFRVVWAGQGGTAGSAEAAGGRRVRAGSLHFMGAGSHLLGHRTANDASKARKVANPGQAGKCLYPTS